MEGTPIQEKPQITEQIPLSGIETVAQYKRELVRKEAENQLQEMLASVEIDESVPEEFLNIVKLEQLLNDLDTVDFNNDDRHVARLAEENLADELGNMSQRNFISYHNYKTNKDVVAEVT